MTHIPGTGHSNRRRSLIKTLTWRLIATTDTFILTFFAATWVGGDLGISGTQATGLAATVASLEIVTKIFLYYFHERAWSWSDWGLEDVPLETPESIESTATALS